MEFKSFLDYLLLEKKYSAKTIVADKNDLVSFSVFNEREFSQKFIKNANYSQIRSWIVFLVDNEISNQSINRKISSLNSYYKFLLKTDSIIKNPLSSHKALKTKTTIQLPFSENEINSVLNSINFSDDFEGHRDRLILEILYSTGIRRQELINIKLKNIDISNSTIKVLGKRKKERYIPLINSTVSLINIYLKFRENVKSSNKDHLFITSKGKMIYDNLVYRITKNIFLNIQQNKRKALTY